MITMDSPVASPKNSAGIDRLNTQTISLSPELDAAVARETEAWRADGRVARLWQRDTSLWTGGDEDKWVGWLTIVEESAKQLADYRAFAQDVRGAAFTDALLLGMGGSSLGPEVLAEIFGAQPGFPHLRIIDSTDPAQILATEAAVKLASTLVIISSKSGSTTEPNMLLAYFFNRLRETVGEAKAGEHVVTVTDPGSSMEKVAKRDKFRRIFYGEPTIGGRYSVLSPFGLVPAAAAGYNVDKLVAAAQAMMRACGAESPPATNPGVQLGLALGVAAMMGRDKVTFNASPRFADFGAWTQQLIAESTGKNGKAIIPIDFETLGPPEVYGEDRFFIDLRMASEASDTDAAALAALEKAGHPVVRIVMHTAEDVAQEFFRFEIATAVAGAVMKIHPFDQPDVEATKIKTRELIAAFEASGKLPSEVPVFSDDTFALYTDTKNAEALRKGGAAHTAESWLKAHFARLDSGDYAAILAYIARSPAHTKPLQTLRLALRDRYKVATSVEFGPRFLHSTGQAYKGGPDSGVFLQVTADDRPDLAIPGQKASFGIIKAAQARGDFDVLAERGRRALRVHVKGDLDAGLAALSAAVTGALAEGATS
ncbi:MAG: bifunctional transaldolase/phosoglucose isomerase [Xanthobacteraceae bacterium]